MLPEFRFFIHGVNATEFYALDPPHYRRQTQLRLAAIGLQIPMARVEQLPGAMKLGRSTGDFILASIILLVLSCITLRKSEIQPIRRSCLLIHKPHADAPHYRIEWFSRELRTL